MPRPTPGDLPSSAPLSPYQAPPTAVPGIVGPAPLSYAGQPIPPAPMASSVPTAAGLINAFKRRWVLGTFVGLLVAISASIVIWLAMPAGKHEASGLIELRDKTFELANRNNEDYENYRKTQMYILKTRDLLSRTVNDPSVSSLEMIRNNEDPVRTLEENITVTAGAPALLKVTMKGNNLDDMRTIVDSLMKRYVDDATAADRRDRTENIKKLEKLERELQEQIEAAQKYVTGLAKASGATGTEGAANQQGIIMSRLVELRTKIAGLTDETTHLQSQLKELDKQLGSYKITDKTLENLKQSGIPDLIYDRLKTLKDREYRSRLIFSEEINGMVKEDQDYLRKNIIAAAQMPETLRPIIPEGMIIKELNNDVRVVKLKLDLEELEGLLARESSIAGNPQDSPLLQDLKERVKAKEKDVDRKKAEIRTGVLASIKSATINTLEQTVINLESKIATNKTTRDQWKQEEDSLKQTSGGNAASNIEVSERVKAIQAQRETVEKVQLLIVQNRAQSQMDNRARVRETAQALPNNNLNKKLLISTSLGVATFAFVILMVAFLEWRTRRVDGVDQVVNELGMRIVGTVPVFPNRASLKAAAEVGGANWRFALNEAINSTRTMLLHTARSQSMQVVMVTSATQGEGKTSITSQLATSMATAGMRTLIVDCDLRNPSIHKLFDLHLTAGVSEILTQEADPTDAIQPTSVPNLWVIPAGQCSNRVIAALAQGHPLETLFNRLRGQFDFVIVDSCPVLPVADALLIGQHVDGVVFSIMQDISQIPKVILASEKLTQLNIVLLGAVVNGIKQDVYSYGYNYVKQLPA